jgi:UDP-2,4-diacetamido-2,4,6-trideoxy-beta-L-altropyranose hydrolase
MVQTVCFRTDASIEMGTGHVMRCMTLAAALQKAGATILFIARAHAGHLNRYIESEGFKVHELSISKGQNGDKEDPLTGYERWLGCTQEEDADDTLSAIGEIQPKWMVIDHYGLNKVWEKRVRPYMNKIMVIDDLANRQHECDLLLDQNYIKDKSRYNALLSPEVIQLLGPDYALLREEFSKFQENITRPNRAVERIFLFFGGTDPENLTSLALHVLLKPGLDQLDVDVVVGSGNPHQEEIKLLIARHPKASLFVQVDHISDLMMRSDLALGGGGATTWERMVVGLPSVVVTVAENQLAATQDLHSDGYLHWIGNSEQVGEGEVYSALLDVIGQVEHLWEQASRGQQLVAVDGARRIARLLINGPDPAQLIVREATLSDCLLYWYWVNDPTVRESAFQQEPISWESHQRWFQQKLDDPNTVLLLIEAGYGSVGQVRFEREGSCHTISFSLGRLFRGYRLGKVILSSAIEFFRQKRCCTLVGDVKILNTSSIRVFEQLGFDRGPHPLKKDAYRFQQQFS